jgi:hypothetical protein
MNHVLRSSFCIDDASLEQSNPACPAHIGLWSDWIDIGLFPDFIMSKVHSQDGLQPLDYFRRYVNPHLKAAEVIIPFVQGSRFAVAREKILSRPKGQYASLLETLSRNEDPYSGYFMEWLWSALFLGNETHCKLPKRTVAISHAGALNKLMTRYQKGVNGQQSAVQWLRNLAVSGISGTPGDSSTAAPSTSGFSNTGSSTNGAESTTTTAAVSTAAAVSGTNVVPTTAVVLAAAVSSTSVVPTTAKVSTAAAVSSTSVVPTTAIVSTATISTSAVAATPSSATSSTTGTVPSAATESTTAVASTTVDPKRVKLTLISGSVTITVPNCANVSSDANSLNAVTDGLRKQFLTDDSEAKGITLFVTMSCASGRRLSSRLLAGDSLNVNYVITVPATATSTVANIQSTILQSKPSDLTTSIKTAVSQYSFQNFYDLSVASIAAPLVKPVLAADPPRESAAGRLATHNMLLCLAVASMLMGRF